MGHSTEKQTISDRTIKNKVHTTIALKKITKEKIDKIRAPGQCYDGVINELVEYWERYRIGSSLCGPGKPVYNKQENNTIV
jgi:hypothetical protein